VELVLTIDFSKDGIGKDHIEGGEREDIKRPCTWLMMPQGWREVMVRVV
jgi:hypothetical protein